MEKEPRVNPLQCGVSIQRITNDRVADAVQVYANLMPPAGNRINVESGIPGHAASYGEGSSARFTFPAIYTHTSRTELPDRDVDLTGTGSDVPQNDGFIGLAYLSLLEKDIEKPVRIRISREEHDPTYVFVQTMNDVEFCSNLFLNGFEQTG